MLNVLSPFSVEGNLLREVCLCRDRSPHFFINYFSLKILKNNQPSLIEITVSLKNKGSLQVFFFDDTMAEKDFPQELIASLLLLDFQSFG